MNIKVDEYLSKAKKWQQEFEKLRLILLDSQLTEEFKWGWPCYTFGESNIVLRTAVFQGRTAARRPWPAGQANGECPGGSASSLYQFTGNR